MAVFVTLKQVEDVEDVDDDCMFEDDFACWFGVDDIKII